MIRLLKDLFPINWILCGILGLCLDLVKAPGYIIGAIALPLLNIIKKIKT